MSSPNVVHPPAPSLPSFAQTTVEGKEENGTRERDHTSPEPAVLLVEIQLSVDFSHHLINARLINFH